MDSLGDYHDKSIPTKALRRWLNSEWKRLRGDQSFDKVSNDKVFTRPSIPMINVKVPEQSCIKRCGVYTVRFGYNVYIMRNMRFTASLVRNNCRAIVDSPAFRFGDSDMDRFRAEIKALILKLSAVYMASKYGDTPSNSFGGDNGDDMTISTVTRRTV